MKSEPEMEQPSGTINTGAKPGDPEIAPTNPELNKSNPELNKSNPELDKANPESDKINPESVSPRPPVKETELLKDVDLETFYLTGRMDYTFKLGGKLEVKIRLISTDDLAKSHALLFTLMNDPKKSYNSVSHEYASFVVSKVLLKYSGEDVSRMSEEERSKFLLQLPSSVTSAIYNKYARYEATVDKLLSDTDSIKNF